MWELDQVNSIKEETRWSPNLTLDFPDMDTLDILLFEVFPMGENFKSMSNDSTNSDDKLSRGIKTDDIKVFPNPNNGEFLILVKNPSEAKAIYITDILGKRIDSRNVVTRENYYNNMSFKVGVYFIEVLFEDKVITQKFIIN